jgi:hypothetical protein
VDTGEIADVNVWDYEAATLVGTVMDPKAREHTTFVATALSFCHTYPLLAGKLALVRAIQIHLPTLDERMWLSWIRWDG